MLVFWCWLAAAVVTIIVGFAWGEWITGGFAQAMAEDALVKRLAPICFARVEQDPLTVPAQQVPVLVAGPGRHLAGGT